MKVKRFALRPGTTKEILLANGFEEDGGTWITKNAKLFKGKTFEFHACNGKGDVRSCGEFYIGIAFTDDIEKWSDIDNVTILDEDFGQPHIPFYHHFDKEVKGFYVLEDVIQQYNDYMASLPFLMEVDADGKEVKHE